MAEKQLPALAQDLPTQISGVRLVIDQARVTRDVLHHQYAGDGTEDSPYVVTWIPDDPGNPMTWSKSYKWGMTMVAAVATLSTAFASSAFSGAIRELETELGASTELITAGISLFVLGFALGPLVWAPLSEIFGRQVIFFVTFGAFTAFNAGCAGANDIATLLVLRFCAGATGSSPFTNAGGVIADIFDASERGLAMSLFSLAPSLGPTLGPFIGGFLGETEGWRWVMGLMAIFSGVLWVAQSLLVPETYAVVLLRKRAAVLSKMTGKVYATKIDIQKGSISVKEIVVTTLTRPWILLILEPIVLLLSLYLAIVYGTLYLLFGAYPIVFQVYRGWSEGVGGLAFLGVAVGMMTAIAISGPLNKLYLKDAAKHGGIAPPEARLIGAMIGAVAIPTGMFWFAWTNAPSVSWVSPVAAGAPFGFGLVLVFVAVTSYLIDAYTIFAASALAANTVIRSLFGAAFPLFTQQMFAKLGIHWASSIPGFLALACVPFPFILFKYGAAIRSRCVYAAQAEAAMIQLRAQAAGLPPTGEPKLSSATTRDSEQTGASDTEPDQDDSARYEPIRVPTSADHEPMALTRTRSGSMIEASNYQASPFDIDRVYTSTSLAGLELKRTRTNTNASVGR